MQNVRILGVVAAMGLAAAAQANLIISEVHPSGSGNGSYNADWFELTNTGSTAIDITGWKVDDNSNAFASAIAFRGLTSIPAGASVIFAEANSAGTNDQAVIDAFKLAWFGSNVPAGFLIGTYGGSQIGLSTGGDAVNIFDASGTLITGVAFGSSTTGVTFDNSAGIGGTSLPLPTISTLSVNGVNGAYVAGAETGSPGAIPAPGAAALLLAGGALLARRRK